MISPKWIDRISWSESEVFVNHPSETFRQSLEYTEDFLLSRNAYLHAYLHARRDAGSHAQGHERLMPHMIGEVMPLITQPMIDYLQEKS